LPHVLKILRVGHGGSVFLDVTLRQKFIDVSEERTTFTLSAEEYAKQTKKQAASKVSRFY
jgi:hypothetical protein